MTRVSSRDRRMLLLAFCLTLAACHRGTPSSSKLILATTTSVGNSGLLDALLPACERQAHIAIDVHLAGSGRALAMMTGGAADVVISHAPRAETEFLSAHPHAYYRKLMFNDFVVVGPKADPARVRDAPDISDAMRRIANAPATVFISRGDESGTHERERELWARARATMPPDRLLVSGAGMAVTLRQADTKRAYTLADRATFEQVGAATELIIAFSGGPDLLNTYAVVVGRPDEPVRGDLAMAFARWLSDGGGRGVIAAFKGKSASPMFTLWDTAWPRSSPADLPQRQVIARAEEPERLWIVPASDHRFNDDQGEIQARLDEALSWVEDAAGTPAGGR